MERVDSVVKLGDRLQVKVIAIDDQDRVKLSRKALLRDQAQARGGAPAGAGAGGERREGGREGGERREGGRDRDGGQSGNR